MEYELEEDATAAIFNREGSELNGRVLRCTQAKANKFTPQAGKAVWNAEEWIQNSLGDGIDIKDTPETVVS